MGEGGRREGIGVGLEEAEGEAEARGGGVEPRDPQLHRACDGGR